MPAAFSLPCPQLPAGYIAISTAEEFSNIRNNPSGKYILANDIDFKRSTLDIIENFTGMLDGNGKTISNFQAPKGLF